MTELLEKQTDCKMYHISELQDKTARNIVSTDLLPDGYHYEIWTAARVLCRYGYNTATLLGYIDDVSVWRDGSTLLGIHRGAIIDAKESWLHYRGFIQS